jgi:hypothetical protein
MTDMRPAYVCSCSLEADWFLSSADKPGGPSFAACDSHLLEAIRFMYQRLNGAPMNVWPVNVRPEHVQGQCQRSGCTQRATHRLSDRTGGKMEFCDEHTEGALRTVPGATVIEVI